MPCFSWKRLATQDEIGSKVGFDATRKWAGEGLVRPWPDAIVMSDDVRSLVDRRWAEYGIGANGVPSPG